MNDSLYIKLHVPSSIDYLNRIMEGYEYLGVVTTIDKLKGVVCIRVTPDTYQEVKTILSHTNIMFEYIYPPSE